MTHDEWRLAISQTIGGSSAGAVLGVDRFTTKRRLWQRMKAARNGVLEPERDGPDLRRGRLMEELAMQLAIEELGRMIERFSRYEIQRSAAYPWAHASPDGYFDDDDIVEVKVPRPAGWAAISLRGLPKAWTAQATHNIAVTGASACQFVILNPVTCDLHTPRVERDNAAIDSLMAEERVFFESLAGDVPPEEHEQQQATADDLLVPDLLTDAAEAVEAAKRYTQLLSMRDEADELLTEAKHSLCRLVGCEIRDDGRIVGGPESFQVGNILRVIHRERAGARTFDAAQAKLDYPALRDDEKYYKQGKPSRPFLVRLLGDG